MPFEFRFQNHGPEVDFSGTFIVEATFVPPANLSMLYDEKQAPRVGVSIEYTN
jgi:hypothetical protein